jgi:hypothetical protein
MEPIQLVLQAQVELHIQVEGAAAAEVLLTQDLQAQVVAEDPALL